jgi:serine/threonine protein kinase
MSSEPAAKGPRRNIRIGKYEVLSHVATGGMGAVYKARDTEHDRVVALKVLSPEMAGKPAMVERFRREAKHAAKLCHENVVTLYEFGESNHTYFLAMEFVDGIDLHEYSNRQGPLDPDVALDIILQACRAIDHAFAQGVVHRDIKPSNFLLTQVGDRRVIKMTDLGLAREASNEEFRVTKAGTTVGTLDYMSPEQARDSGLADIRSDLYSLGSTWYHLLAGHAPFPKGGLGERLNRILNEEPPDVRKFNPRVSAPMASVVHRLLAKRPSERYQTPADLLQDLETLARGEPLLSTQDLLQGLAQEEGEAIAPPSSSVRKRRPPSTASGMGDKGAGRRPPPPSSRVRARADTESGKATPEELPAEAPVLSRSQIYGIAGAAVLLVVVLVVLFSLRRARKEQALATDAEPIASAPNVTPITPTIPAANPDAGKKPDERPPAVAPPKKPSWPALYQPAHPVDFAALRKEIEAARTPAPVPAQSVELVVGRLPPGDPGKTFPSLAAACKAIPAGATGVIELRDNGPFFDISAVIADRSLVLRAAKGFRPLLVWDVQRTLDERRRNRPRGQPADDSAPLVFLDVKHGNLTLQGIHLALQWPEAPSEGSLLLRVEDGDLTVTGCTFSVAGRPRDGVTVARFTASPSPATGGDKGGSRCRFSHCYARGAELSVLDLDAPGAQVLFENCLLVGGDRPLLQVRAGADRPTEMRAVRSTMICGKNLLTIRPAKAADGNSAFHWLGWDVLLSRKNKEAGGNLVRLADGITVQQLRWRAVNCLYAGWGSLLAAASPIPVSDVSAWQRLWGRDEGDVVQTEPWPSAVFPEPAEMPAATYRTADSAVAFASSDGPEHLLGCEPDALAPARDNWLPLTFGRFAIVAPAVPDDPGPPEIPTPVDALYHGERLDLTLNPIDLGAYLQEVQRTRRFAPQVVLHLTGSGERFTSPIRIKGSSLVLYFEPPPEKTEAGGEKTAEALALVPAGRSLGEALVEIEQGNLDLINGRLRLSDAVEARVLPWLIKVRGGDVRLFRSRLEVPPRSSGTAFRGLISLNGSGDVATERVRSCAVNETILMSARDGIRVQGVGARVLLTQTLLIAGDDALRLTLAPGFTDRANVQCLLDHATVAAQGSVVHVADVAAAEPPAEPVVVQTHDCVFLNLFLRRGAGIGLSSKASLVHYDGEVLARGLLVWQSDDDAFDRRLWFGAVSAEKTLPEKREDHTSWLALWGTPAFRHAQLDLYVPTTLLTDRWALERLIGLKVSGVNLEKIGLKPKPMKKTPR